MVNILSEYTKRIDDVYRRRALAKNSLVDFFKYRLLIERRLERTVWGWHIDYVCDILEACYRREILRLIMNIPPRHFKSELVQTFAAWVIGRDNDHNASMVTASYSAGLAYTNSRKTREIVNSEWYRQVFGHDYVIKYGDEVGRGAWELGDEQDPPELSSGAIKEWVTNGGASFVAAGVGGELTGKGGDYLVGDDLLKPKDANSEVMREKTNEWLGETFASRLNNPNNGCIIHICQRLHELDPAGYLLEKAKNPLADQYYHVTIPLIAEKSMIYQVGDVVHKVRREGELIDERWIDKKRADALKVSMGPNFEGQYQQNPNKMEGGMLKPKLVNLIKRTPNQIIKDEGLRPVLLIDGAFTEKENEKDDPDYTVGTVYAKGPGGRRWILDMIRGQWATNTAAEALYAQWRRWGCQWAFCEKGAVLRALNPWIKRIGKTKGKLMSIHGVSLPRTGDAKVNRAFGFQAWLNGGAVWAPDDMPWWHPMSTEMAGFPRGSHDDIVDTLGMAAMEEVEGYMPDFKMNHTPEEKFDDNGQQIITGEELIGKAGQSDVDRMIQEMKDRGVL